MLGLYESESKRVEEINKVFQAYDIQFTVTEVEKTGCAVEADISVNGHRYVIAECKNETGKSHIVFAGAAWNLRPTVQILSKPIPFGNHYIVARHMAAFSRAAEELKQYYETLEATPLPTSGPVPQQVFPYPTNYKSLVDQTEKQFNYLMAADQGKLTFYGVEDKGDNICIKFTQAYSHEAHEHMASLGCAPALRGFKELDSDWYIVIMDRLSNFELLSCRRGGLSLRVFELMSEKLKEFHNAGFVHGSICDMNIMVSKMDEMQFMFINFDWAGHVGEVGEGGYSGEHDLYMLDQMARSYGLIKNDGANNLLR
ncbi:hypothetical protein ID866_11439 [Astraeus odoratus]|nr:hypothetical protein ID866_11439 [Astraeus odoratus]